MTIPFSKRPLLTIIAFSLLLSVSLLVSILGNEHIQVSVFGKVITPVSGLILTPTQRIDPEAFSFDPDEVTLLEGHVRLGKYGEWTYCHYEVPDDFNPKVELLMVEQETTDDGAAEVDMLFKNTGNGRLFSAEHPCAVDFPVFNVGTALPQDRASALGNESVAVSGWVNPQRVAMEEIYADPGEVFHVRFESTAPNGEAPNIYREFFQPVVEGVAWLSQAFAFDVVFGEPDDSMKQDIRFVSDLSIDAATLAPLERNLESVLSEQTMYARFGDMRVWSMPISSGHYDTPTPRGRYKIFQKQPLRIGGKAPFYHMPWWQYFGEGGYGIHGLPYLTKDGGTFWQEAENHMGYPVSHGCIRTLDRDAQTLYEFTSIGTPLWVH